MLPVTLCVNLNIHLAQGKPPIPPNSPKILPQLKKLWVVKFYWLKGKIVTDRDNAYFSARREQRKNTHKRVELQLTIKEYNEFLKIAKQENLTTSKVIKNMAVAYKDSKYYVPDSIKQSLSKVSFLIRNIANNLNQMSHSANVLGGVDRNAVFGHLQQLDKTVSDFVKGKIQ